MRARTFNVLTIFPQMIEDFTNYAMIARAVEAGLVKVNAFDIRDHATDKHRQVDDQPYGGGAGMVMKAEPITRCLDKVLKNNVRKEKTKIILLSPQGRIFNQKLAKEFAEYEEITLICGRYEGIDSRVEENFIDDTVSIGDYILTGGELAAMVFIEAVARLVPGVLGDEQSALQESFEESLLEYPQYTRPEVFEGLKVPDVLLSGNHKEIDRWRRQQSLLRTFERRPDMLNKAKLDKEDMKFLTEIKPR